MCVCVCVCVCVSTSPPVRLFKYKHQYGPQLSVAKPGLNNMSLDIHTFQMWLQLTSYDKEYQYSHYINFADDMTINYCNHFYVNGTYQYGD